MSNEDLELITSSLNHTIASMRAMMNNNICDGITAIDKEIINDNIEKLIELHTRLQFEQKEGRDG